MLLSAAIYQTVASAKKYEEEKIDSYEDAVKKLLEEEEIDTTKRNVLLSHQFYLSGGSEPLTCDSEIRMAGGD